MRWRMKRTVMRSKRVGMRACQWWRQLSIFTQRLILWEGSILRSLHPFALLTHSSILSAEHSEKLKSVRWKVLSRKFTLRGFPSTPGILKGKVIVGCEVFFWSLVKTNLLFYCLTVITILVVIIFPYSFSPHSLCRSLVKRTHMCGLSHWARWLSLEG